MPNIKSAAKRVQIAEVNRKRNMTIKTKVKTIVKNFDSVIANQDKDNAFVALNKAIIQLDKAAHKGVIHKNAAARKKSRLFKKYNTLMNA